MPASTPLLTWGPMGHPLTTIFTEGQYASVIVPAANAVNLPNGTTINVITATLPPGEWILSGEVWFNVTTGTPSIQQIAGSVSLVSASAPANPADNTSYNLQEPNQSRSAGTQVGFILPLSTLYVVVVAPTPYYLTAFATWTGTGAMAAYGKLAGRLLPQLSPAV
jgi:hypothetical protein